MIGNCVYSGPYPIHFVLNRIEERISGRGRWWTIETKRSVNRLNDSDPKNAKQILQIHRPVRIRGSTGSHKRLRIVREILRGNSHGQ